MKLFTPKKLIRLERDIEAIFNTIQEIFDHTDMTQDEAEGDIGALVVIAQGHLEQARDYIREALS